ncbi:hypothetical protein [Blastococcus haudaquaticus]|uniref:Uncharacterized protein n=1 Tax=Blastococcus haudaquaticus TaxID=1938745 RepID=A0A286GJM6_9ACTN|nr:hypothetical protein [Blastococcus haudaquaticus]SOD95737.1 hypothetical protein SAMN06272739_1334 [Blastococcus haudaquaticus]
MSGERSTAAQLSTHLAGPDREARQEYGLAGLIDVLDRADGVSGGRRAPARRASAHRPAGGRAGTVRTVPLRSVQPAPMARPTPVPRAFVLPEPERVPVTGLSDLVRRAALWGAGPRGENLAWKVRPAAPAAPRPSRLRALVRRAALWGAGPGGEHLSWGRPAVPAARPDVDPPVVLREMPSTPTIKPAAPSPAVALLPRVPASSAGPRGMPPITRGAVAVPGIRPGGPPERSRATGWPPQSRRSPMATGLARARGDPSSCPVRGSPPTARRSRSPGSAWSSFP